MHRSLKMDAAKRCMAVLTLKSIFSKMAQKWPKNCIFSNFPLTFLMVIGDIVEKYFFFLPILTPMTFLKTESARYLTVSFTVRRST